jgi:hypothetical protein
MWPNLSALPEEKDMSTRKPGLWFTTMKVEVQETKKAHKKRCQACEELPEKRRLVVLRGGGRHSLTSVYCVACGVDYLTDFLCQGERAIKYLEGDPSVRSIR